MREFRVLRVTALAAFMVVGCQTTDQGTTSSRAQSASAAAVKPTSTGKVEKPTVEEIRAAFTGRESKVRTRRTGQLMVMKWKPDGALERELHTDSGIRYASGKWWVNPDSTYCQTTSSGESCFAMEKEGGNLYRIRDGKRFAAPIPLKQVAQTASATWVDGKWASRTGVLAMDIKSDGSRLSGSAAFKYGSGTANGELEGTVNGDKVNITVKWPERGTTSSYELLRQEDGALRGTITSGADSGRRVLLRKS